MLDLVKQKMYFMVQVLGPWTQTVPLEAKEEHQPTQGF